MRVCLGSSVFLRVCEVRGKRTPTRRARGLEDRGLMGPGRVASPLQVIKEEIELEQLESSRRWSLELHKKDFEGGEHAMPYTDVVL